MKRFFQWYFDNVFSGLRAYRKWRKGTWYKVIDIDAANGMAGPYPYWSRTAPPDWPILETEVYSPSTSTNENQ